MHSLFARRSIRQYRPDPISDDQLHDLLHAAMVAPSAGDERPWQFLVLRDRSMLDHVPELHPYAAMVRQAPLAIVVCGDESLEVHRGFWVQDCAAATQNMLIAATAMGLGSVWVGIYPAHDRVEAFRRFFRMPPNIIPFSLVPIGYAAEEKPPAQRFDATRVHFDTWQSDVV